MSHDYIGPPLPSVAEVKGMYPVFRLPEFQGLNGELDPHQHVAVAAAHVAKRFLNMDKVGLGKTVETLALIAYQRHWGRRPRWFICVENAQLVQWEESIKDFLGITAIRVTGKSKAQRDAIYRDLAVREEFIALISYGSVRTDFDLIQAVPKRSMAYDEAALLANVNDTSKKATWLNRGCEYVILLSAEPITRGDPTQVWTIFQTMGVELMPEREFDQEFCVHETKKMMVRGRFGSYLKEMDTVVGLKNAPRLRELMAPFCIRRGDSVLPGGAFRINRQIRTVDMTAAQRQVYQELKRSAASIEQGDSVARLRTASALTQVMVAPWVWDQGMDADSPKLNLLMEMLKGELAERQVVVFCKYLKACELTSEYLTKNGVPHGVYTGEIVGADARRDAVKAFMRGEHRILVTSSAGHRGVDGLQVAHNLVVIDVVHQPSTIIQLLGRLARRGQQSRVINTYFLLCEGSVETKVMKVLHNRQSVADLLYSEDRADIFERKAEDLMLELL